MVFDVGFKVLTALKGWVGQAAKRTGALHIINCRLWRSRALHIIIILIFDYFKVERLLLLAKYYFIFRLKFIV